MLFVNFLRYKMTHFPLMELVNSFCRCLTLLSPCSQNSEINSSGGDSMSEVFGIVFDESKNLPTEISDSNIWFSLDHPKVHI